MIYTFELRIAIRRFGCLWETRKRTIYTRLTTQQYILFSFST